MCIRDRNNPLHIVLIAVPLVLQTVLIFFVAYGWAKWWKLPHDIAAPAGMIGASNFFELAVAVAISLLHRFFAGAETERKFALTFAMGESRIAKISF